MVWLIPFARKRLILTNASATGRDLGKGEQGRSILLRRADQNSRICRGQWNGGLSMCPVRPM